MSATFVTQSRIASLIASLSVAAARLDRAHLRAQRAPCAARWASAARCRARPCTRRTAGRAARATVAVATPCWPAPVSAMRRVLPSRRASSAWPSDVVDLVRAGVGEVLALQVDRAPPCLARPRAGPPDRAGVGRPAKCVPSSRSSAQNVGSSRTCVVGVLELDQRAASASRARSGHRGRASFPSGHGRRRRAGRRAARCGRAGACGRSSARGASALDEERHRQRILARRPGARDLDARRHVDTDRRHVAQSRRRRSPGAGRRRA